MTNFLVRMGIPLPTVTLDAIAVFLITLILSYVTLVFGELVPKRVAMKNSEKIALGMGSILNVLAKVLHLWYGC